MLSLLLALFACDRVSLGENIGSGGGGAGTTASSVATTGGVGGTGGGHAGPCGVDCSKLQTVPCTVAVCNTGQVAGPLDTCVVIPAPDGTTCDDGQFCTTGDVCKTGTCVGGPQNECGLVLGACTSVICYESSKSCSITPVADGTTCTATDLCQVNSACQAGGCVGVPKDCTFSPLNECNSVACDPGTGMCKATPAANKDGTSCVLTGDLCKVDKTCLAGQCTGGAPKDCSALDVGCQVGVCDGMNGLCGPANAPAGTVCTDGLQACQVGACDMNGKCVASAAPDGTACNDHDACTQGDKCTAGVCAGTPIAGCMLYLYEGFETCPDGWTFGGDWQCGTPGPPSPVTPHTGHGVIATQLDGLYHNDQSFNTCVADSPPLDLTQATAPQVSFWAWVHTEGGSYDGWNMKVSTDGGMSFQEVMMVTPPYPLTILGQPSWGGDLSAQGWQSYTAGLTAYAGHSIILRFAFRSDPATVYPGVYIDDVVVAEPVQIPLYITTTSPLEDVYVGQSYSVALAKIGGTSNSVWSIGGGMNDGWLAINAATGVLSGTPSAAQVGPVSVTVHVEEPTLPSNFAEKTFTFNVKPDIYYTSWEGTCPDGWTLSGDPSPNIPWQCGVPTNTAGPATAYDGTQCIGVGMFQFYSDNDTWAGTTATSPPLVLPGLTSPTLTFRMWFDTEGGTFDGANVQISTDGGMTYSVLNTVMPPYALMIAGEPAWGGHQSALGWQLVQADLTAFAGKTILLRFAFRSDAANTYAGFYVDDLLVE
jgi:hypothetical protein